MVGGMEKVNQRMLEALAIEWDPMLCGPPGCANHAPRGTIVRQTRLRPVPVFLLFSLARAMRLAREFRPRHIVAGSGLMAPVAFIAARLVGASCSVYLHGLDIIAPSRLYQWLWLPFIRACGLVLVNSENTAALARSRGVSADRIHVLHPGTDLPPPGGIDVPALKQQLGLSGRPLLLSVGRFTRRKGLAEFVSRALPMVADSHPDVLLIVIGGEASDAVRGHAGERQRIESAARQAGVGRNVQFAGRADDLQLEAYYNVADCHVFPVLDLPGDVEGFGMVALEAAAHGLPTVAFSVGGIPDAVADTVTGRLVESGDYAGFADAIAEVLATSPDNARASACRQFALGKSWPVFSERLRELLRGHDG